MVPSKAAAGEVDTAAMLVGIEPGSPEIVPFRINAGSSVTLTIALELAFTPVTVFGKRGPCDQAVPTHQSIESATARCLPLIEISFFVWQRVCSVHQTADPFQLLSVANAN